MIAYKIPPGRDGILCALFESFTAKEKPVAVFCGHYQEAFDCRVKIIKVLPKNAERVRNGLLKCGGISLLSKLFYVLRSGEDIKESVIFNAAYACLAARKDLTENYADPNMLALYELSSKISFEAHRMKGFLRFQKTVSGVWYGHFTPDNNVIDLIAPHFQKRFPKERFVIHDLSRRLVTLYDGKSIVTAEAPENTTIFLGEDEVELQNLWRTYFDAVTLEGRDKRKIQDGFLPKRYRTNMDEFLCRDRFF